MPSDVWKMNWLSFGAGGHLKALKWGDKVDLVQKFQCEDGEAVGFMFVLGALIWLPGFQLIAMRKREAQTSGVILHKNKQWTDSSSD